MSTATASAAASILDQPWALNASWSLTCRRLSSHLTKVTWLLTVFWWHLWFMSLLSCCWNARSPYQFLLIFKLPPVCWLIIFLLWTFFLCAFAFVMICQGCFFGVWCFHVADFHCEVMQIFFYFWSVVAWIGFMARTPPTHTPLPVVVVYDSEDIHICVYSCITHNWVVNFTLSQLDSVAHHDI